MLGNVAMKRLAWFESASVQQGLALLFLILFLSAWAGWPLYFAFHSRSSPEKKEGYLLWPPALAAFLNTLSLLGLAYYLLMQPDILIYGVPPFIIVLLTLPLLAGIFTLSSLWLTGKVWRRGSWSPLAKVHYSLVVLSLVLFIPFLHYWNLLGFRF